MQMIKKYPFIKLNISIITMMVLILSIHMMSFAEVMTSNTPQKDILLVELTDDANVSLVSAIKESRTAAEILKDYGIIQGYNGDLMVDSELTRAEACVLLADLYGLKEEATGQVFIEAFSDVSDGAWYTPYVTFAKEKGWISGYPDGSFKPDQAINGQEWASMMLTLMGYPFTWETVAEEIETLGINFKDDQFETFYRGEAFELLWQVLNTDAYGEDITMGLKLGYFVDPLANSAEVSAYITPSLRMVKLKFNNPIIINLTDSYDSFEVTKLDGSLVALSFISYDETTNELSLIFNEALLTYDVINIKITDVLAEDSTILEPIIVEGITMIDINNPSLLSASLTEDDQVILTFSEPILAFDETSFSFDQEVEVTALGFIEGNRVVTIGFNLNDGELTKPESIRLFNTITDDYGHSLMTQNVMLVTE